MTVKKLRRLPPRRARANLVYSWLVGQFSSSTVLLGESGKEFFANEATLLATRRDSKYCGSNGYGPQIEVIRFGEPVLYRGVLLFNVALERNEDQAGLGDPGLRSEERRGGKECQS